MAAVTTSMGSSDGVSSYYLSKIEELEVVVRERTQNLRRLEAQRNELARLQVRGPACSTPPSPPCAASHTVGSAPLTAGK